MKEDDTYYMLATRGEGLYKEKGSKFIAEIASFSSRNIVLKDGRIIDDKYNDNIQSAAEALAAMPPEED